MKVDTLFDIGSQVNLISESIVKKSVLKIEPHRKPYPLAWVKRDKQLQVTRQCKLKFAISSKFANEATLDEVTVDEVTLVFLIYVEQSWVSHIYMIEKPYSIKKKTNIIFLKIRLNILLELIR